MKFDSTQGAVFVGIATLIAVFIVCIAVVHTEEKVDRLTVTVEQNAALISQLNNLTESSLKELVRGLPLEEFQNLPALTKHVYLGGDRLLVVLEIKKEDLVNSPVDAGEIGDEH